jgi:hypothetical protein
MASTRNTITPENSLVATGVTADKLKNLRTWNVGLTVLHLGQAVAMLL